MKDLRKHGKQPFIAAVIHGGPGALGDMYPVAKQLSKEFGTLEPLQTKTSIDELVYQLTSIIVKNADKPITLIGHSWGAWLSIMFASVNPSLVKKLILVGCAPFEPDYAKDIMKTRLNRLDEKERKKFKTILDSLSEQNNPESIKELFYQFNKTDSYRPVEVKENKTFSLELHNSIWNEAEKLRNSGELLRYVINVTCPITIIHGTYDPHPLKGVIKPLSKIVKDVKVITLERCGHTPWNEEFVKEKFFSILEIEIE
ncbi:MAG: alpha/beta hydrolase [Kosmotogaceae bacterium]